jgi:hypothetical protein
VSATELFIELGRQGFSLAPSGEGIRVRPASRLPKVLREAVRRHKAELLAMLYGRAEAGSSAVGIEGPAAAVDWDQAEANCLVAEVQAARFEWFGRSGWPADPCAYRQLGTHFDRIDGAWLSRDRAALQSAVRDTLALIVGATPPEPPPSPSRAGGNSEAATKGGLFAGEVKSGLYSAKM